MCRAAAHAFPAAANRPSEKRQAVLRAVLFSVVRTVMRISETACAALGRHTLL
ncbi:hypothetical protein [Kingella potus]|uniref:hypothetical protein n=1 Tax=Kingella potus TaxID=265175 RepID=UPI001FD2445E|nr:hypothetical protein [Kingella potus]UOP00267.1 hypothetical protein LVJ84_10145 [Kingella potus]